jgi:PIN domain nuclease of toxin-antitoxin system
LILLSDTHSLIWYSLDDPKLSANARALLKDANKEILISLASFWEIAIKFSVGKLVLQRTYEDFVDVCLNRYGFKLLPIEPAHATYVASMPFPRGHKDPFDRLLIAQAMVEGVPIVSVDVTFDHYPVRRVW